MPTYPYACTACDHRFEQVQAFTDPSLTECPVCAGRLRKVFSSVGIVFKGSGFYRNDARAGASSGASEASGGPDSASTDAGSSAKEPSAAGSGTESSGKEPAGQGSGGQGSGGTGSAGRESTGSAPSTSSSGGAAGSGAKKPA